MLQKLGRHEEAIQHARRVCELEPNDPFSFTALSVTYQRAFAGTNNMQYIRMAEDAMEQSRMLAKPALAFATQREAHRIHSRMFEYVRIGGHNMFVQQRIPNSV